MTVTYFTAKETVERVHGLHSISTLNKWANFIQKNCHYHFHYESSSISHKKRRVFTLEEINRLNQVVPLIAEKGRDGALRQVFDTVTDSCTYYSTTEIYALLMEQLEQQLTTTRQQAHEQQNQLENEVRHLDKRLKHLEEQINGSSSGWFRRKR
ncbi:hypothetical protein [Enterococcus olivae]